MDYNKSKAFKIVTFLFIIAVIGMFALMAHDAKAAEPQFRGRTAVGAKPVECVTVSWDVDGSKCNGVSMILERWAGYKDLNGVKEYESDQLTFTGGFPNIVIRYSDQLKFLTPDSKYPFLGIGWFYNEVPDTGVWGYFSADSNAALLPMGTIVPVDYDAPTITLGQPTSTILSGTAWFSAQASDDIGVTKVEFYQDTDLLPFSTLSTAPYLISTDTLTVTNGDHTLTAVAYDASGKSARSSITYTVHNNVAPVSNAGADQTVIVPLTTLTLTGTGLDSDGTIASYSWAQTTGTPAVIKTPTTKTTSVTGFQAGVNTFQLTVTDNSGASTMDEVVITASLDTIPPTSALTTPLNGTIIKGTASGVSATATDNVKVTKLEYLVGTKVVRTETGLPFIGTWNTKTVPNGTYQMTARARDAAGNVTISAPITVTVAN